MLSQDKETSLKEFARKTRLNCLEMTSSGKSSHIASAFSIVDILTVLYNYPILKYKYDDHRWEHRDRFILSKGHAGAAVYSALALSGFFDISKLKTHYQNGSDLSGHISHINVSGVELSTGSLGHGLGVGVGIALGLKKKQNNSKVFVLMSDGELDEGSNWEAILFATHFKLDNLIIIVDYNKLQSLESIENTIGLEPLLDKFKAFNLDVEIVNGHNYDELVTVLLAKQKCNKPRLIIANTIKGKGVKFMENKVLWHYRTAAGLELKNAKIELESK